MKEKIKGSLKEKRNLKSPKEFLLLFLVTILISGPILIYAINTIYSGYYINENQKTIDAHNVCREVYSTSENRFFAPTKTAEEWELFRNGNPSDVVLNPCQNLFIITVNDILYIDYALNYTTLINYPQAYGKSILPAGTACSSDNLFMETLAVPYQTNSDCNDESPSTSCRTGVTVYQQKCISGVIPAYINY